MTTNITTKEYDLACKKILKLASVARSASQNVGNLEDKIKYQRLATKADDIWREMKKIYFDVEDVTKISVGK